MVEFKDICALADMFSDTPSVKGLVGRQHYDTCINYYRRSWWEFWKPEPPADYLSYDFYCKRQACKIYHSVDNE